MAGCSRITLDVRGVRWVAPEIFGEFLEHNRERLAELAHCTRFVHLKARLETLRQQVGDNDTLRVLAALGA